MKSIRYLLTGICLLFLVSCQVENEKSLKFSSTVVSENADLWWARTLADINQDGLVDIVLQNKNGQGGWLGWIEATTDTTQLWDVHILFDSLENGEKFAAGDLDLADIDGDGDDDIIGVTHPGEWVEAGAPANLYWFENPEWKRHKIGQIPDALKDINLGDLDNDGKIDIVAITFDEGIFTIFKQEEAGEFSVAQQFPVKNLHEGMDIGDIDGDGDLDVAANGYWMKNPGGDIAAETWEVLTIDTIWHNQTGDWSMNATKVACKDLTGDGKAEVFISHSERNGYPVALYQLEENNNWKKTVLLDSLPAAHNLQLADFDLDGDLDLLTGVNRSRALNLGLKDYPVYILFNNGIENKWDTLRIHSNGIYNAQVADYEGDGDVDIYRYPTHDATDFELLINQIK